MKSIKDRRSRFEERVRVERLFLKPINERFGVNVPLAGMTKSAIENWVGRLKEAHSAEAAEALQVILLEASSRAELLADSSRDVFERHSSPEPVGLEALALILCDRLRTLDPPPNSA